MLWRDCTGWPSFASPVRGGMVLCLSLSRFGALSGTVEVGARSNQCPSEAAIGDLDRGRNVGDDDVDQIPVGPGGRRLGLLDRNRDSGVVRRSHGFVEGDRR